MNNFSLFYITNRCRTLYRNYFSFPLSLQNYFCTELRCFVVFSGAHEYNEMLAQIKRTLGAPSLLPLPFPFPFPLEGGAPGVLFILAEMLCSKRGPDYFGAVALIVRMTKVL